MFKNLLTGAALGFGAWTIWRYYSQTGISAAGEGGGVDAIAGDFLGVGYQMAGAFDGGGMNISLVGLAHIKGWEGFRSTVYLDQAGKRTIGYGHLIKPGESFGTISEAEASRLLARDVSWAETAVNQAVKVPLSQNQFDALVSFVFNVGVGNFSTSTLLKRLNAGDYLSAQQNFTRWIYVSPGGVKQVSAGLANRRLAEAQLFAGVQVS